MKTVFLYGPPGSGKTAVGRELATRLQLDFTDLDEVIEAQSSMRITQIMQNGGESAFRALENKALRSAACQGNNIIALGGGALLCPENRSFVEACGTVVILDAATSTLLGRMGEKPNDRPLLDGDMPGRLTSLLEQRREHYAVFPIHVSTENRTASQIVEEVQIALGRFRVHAGKAAYDVYLEHEGLEKCWIYLEKLNSMSSVGIVTDSHVVDYYGNQLASNLRKHGFETHLFTIPAGERYKTIETINALWNNFAAAGIDRHSVILALGGGVTSDIAGFAASGYMRGIRWGVLPTSLLGMVDASIGGKTGVDLAAGKNLVGAFYSPEFVLADPRTLQTLPEREIRNGLAEIVKHGIIADPYLFELCQRDSDEYDDAIVPMAARAMAVKIGIIENDPYEHGNRAVLNFGHTCGHAIEAASAYQLSHGEAVSIGMVAETRLAERMGLASTWLSEQIRCVLRALDLPVDIPKGLAKETVKDFMTKDKKKAGHTLHFSLPVEIGKVVHGRQVDDLDLLFEE
jgi:shikimate kinase/3-dehydroquinate synthase